jgi:16S rRNA (adenine1518-N6/adenine1519-N6)-dimethyltransferase
MKPLGPAKVQGPPLPGSPPNLLEAKVLMRRFGVKPDRRLGQNFLVDGDARRKVLDAAGLDANSCVLEIGPGLGALTQALAGMARRVIAVEFDHRLISILEQAFSGTSNIELVCGDVLKIDFEGLIGEDGYVVVANIPYNITSAIIRKLMEVDHKAARLVLTVQQEVAERVIASPGDLSLLALSVQMYGTPRIAGLLPATSFYPVPKVDSAILCVDVHKQASVEAGQIPTFFEIARAGFSQKRKQLHNALAAGLGMPDRQVREWLLDCGIDPGRRAQSLSLQDWKQLVDHRPAGMPAGPETRRRNS